MTLERLRNILNGSPYDDEEQTEIFKLAEERLLLEQMARQYAEVTLIFSSETQWQVEAEFANPPLQTTLGEAIRNAAGEPKRRAVGKC